MKICVPIQENSRKAVQKRLKELSEKADLAEIWLDQIQDIDIKTLLKDKPLPIVAVCKRPAEKGRFRGDFEALAEVLQKAIEAGADYLDLPLDMPEKLNKKIIQKARGKKCKVIISYHDFRGTPDYPELIKLAGKIKKKGADVVKIATYANGLQDTVDMISLGSYLQRQKTPHILIAMGQEGRLSRILTPTLGGEMMFATLGKKRQTASGQLSVRQLQKAWPLIETK